MYDYLGMVLTLVKVFSGLFIVYGVYTGYCALREVSWYMNSLVAKSLIRVMTKTGFKIYSVAIAVAAIVCGILLYIYATPALERMLESVKTL